MIISPTVSYKGNSESIALVMFYLIGMDSFGYGEIFMDCNSNPYNRYKYTNYCDNPFPMLLHILS